MAHDELNYTHRTGWILFTPPVQVGNEGLLQVLIVLRERIQCSGGGGGLSVKFTLKNLRRNKYITHTHSGNNNFKKKSMQNMITVRLHHLCKDVHKLLMILLNACSSISSQPGCNHPKVLQGGQTQ